jgi:hypothetical protein
LVGRHFIAMAEGGQMKTGNPRFVESARPRGPENLSKRWVASPTPPFGRVFPGSRGRPDSNKLGFPVLIWPPPISATPVRKRMVIVCSWPSPQQVSERTYTAGTGTRGPLASAERRVELDLRGGTLKYTLCFYGFFAGFRPKLGPGTCQKAPPWKTPQK